MKKLSLLAPDLQVKYLKGGKGQEVNYLQLPNVLTIKQLEQDIKNGAVQYKECLDLLKKKADRVIAIKCSNKEEGLMAVTYLAAVLNNIEKKDGYRECDDEHLSETREDLDFEDFIMGEPDDDYFDSSAVWEEVPNRIPIIKYGDIRNYDDNMSFFNNNGNLFGETSRNNEIPYWTELCIEPVCIWFPDVSHMGMGFSPFDNDDTNDIKGLDRFCHNRHVFVLLQENPSFAPMFFDGNDVASETLTCNLMLSYSADVVNITMDKNDKEKYYEVLFDNWVAQCRRKLEPGFPKKEIVKKITEIREPDKSTLIHKVMNYVLKNDDVGLVLTKEHFNVLQKFKALGVESDRNERSNTERLKNELVGMEDVKRQVNEIIGVMKYNKMREEAGFGKTGFHNVHLLIGAPGTAKTTVAKLMGNIMCDEHLLPGNRFISINGCDLKGLYVGHTVAKVKSIFRENDIIFIDEAYSITTEGEHDSFSEEAISELIIQMEEHSTDKLIMLAGYGGMDVKGKDNRMKTFIDANPGIKSRINSTIYFESYNAKQMVDIVHRVAKNYKYTLGKGVDEAIEKYFAARLSDRNFGNGREARSLIENMQIHAAARLAKIPVAKISKKMLSELLEEDAIAAIEKVKKDHILQAGHERRLGFTGVM